MSPSQAPSELAHGPPAAWPLRPRVLVLAAACNPYKPSDFAAGWGWVRQLARFCDAWVLCGDWDREDIEHYLRTQGEIPGLHFVFVAPGRFADLLSRGRPWYEIHYLAHRLWHRRVRRQAVRLFQEQRFHLVHHLTRNGFREPGYLWRLEAPFIWGPVGGTQNYPWRFLWSDGLATALKEGCRSLLNVCQLRFSPRVRKARRRAAALLAANSQNCRDLARLAGAPPLLLCDTGVECLMPMPPAKPLPPLKLLWSGKFSPHKALHLLLQALAGLPSDLSYRLHILGAGPQARRWRELARRLGVEPHCRWFGWLPFAEARQHYEWAHALVFTSLRDTSGNVILEALSHGVPVICLDHQGAADIVTSRCGVKVPVTTPDRVIAALRQAILHLARNPHHLEALARGARQRAQDYLWSRQGERMARVYAGVLERKPLLDLERTPTVGEGF